MRSRLASMVLLGVFALSSSALEASEPDVPEPGAQLLHQGTITDIERSERSCETNRLLARSIQIVGAPAARARNGR